MHSLKYNNVYLSVWYKINQFFQITMWFLLLKYFEISIIYLKFKWKTVIMDRQDLRYDYLLSLNPYFLYFKLDCVHLKIISLREKVYYCDGYNLSYNSFQKWNSWYRNLNKQIIFSSCTFYGIHLLFCWVYNGSFPTTFSWWALNIASAAITCVAGEFLCLRTELQAIPLSNIGAKVDLWNLPTSNISQWLYDIWVQLWWKVFLMYED